MKNSRSAAARISSLYEQIIEEISDAHCYVKLVLNVKAGYPNPSRLLHQLSEEEMDHVNRLIEASKRYYNEATISEEGKTYINFVRDFYMDRIKEAKICQSMYKE